jgi:hypothetical protein
MESRLSPKPLSKQTIKEQTIQYLVSLTDEEIKQLLKEVDKIKH